MAELRRSTRTTLESRWVQLAAALPILLGGLPIAHAHIDIEMGGTHKGRSSDSGLKDPPCGTTGSTRGTNVYTYKPGATINIAIAETIAHPGYFRIAFDSDGDDSFVDPAGTSGEMGDCNGDTKCGPGKEDFCSNDTVLLDNLDPHASSLGGTPMYTWSVTLPNIECDNCTIQIIQMMNDLNFHPSPYPADDIYHQCIDIVLSNSAPDVTDVPVTNKGMVCNQSAEPVTGAAGASAAGAGAAAGASGASGASAGASGSTGIAGAAAGAPATAGAAGSPSSSGAPSRPAPSAAGSTATPATAGAPASGAAGTGTTASPATQAGAAATATAPTAEPDTSCSVSAPGAGATSTAAFAWFAALGVVAATRRRRRRAR